MKVSSTSFRETGSWRDLLKNSWWYMVRVACTTDKENLHRAVKLEASEENRIVHESLYWKDSASGSVTNLVLTATGDQAQTDCKEKHTCIISYMQCFSILQECIPVGCVPPALYRTRGGVQEGLCLGVGLCPRGLCPGGSLFELSLSRGSLSRGVSVQGDPLLLMNRMTDRQV